MKTGGLSVINIPEDTISYDSYDLKVFRGGSQVIDKLEERVIRQTCVSLADAEISEYRQVALGKTPN